MSLVVKDSLGMGSKKTIYKEKVYTDEENIHFTRQLLSKEKQDKVKNELLTIEDIKTLFSMNENRYNLDNIDPNLLIEIDSRINYNIYIVDDNIYSHDELCIAYPFQEFNILPSSIFIRQLIVLFKNDSIEVINEGDQIITSTDTLNLVSQKIKTASEIIQAKKIVNSKIFVGKEKWKDFLQMSGFFRGMIQVSNLQIDNGQTPEFLKPFTAMANHLCITDGTNPEPKENTEKENTNPEPKKENTEKENNEKETEKENTEKDTEKENTEKENTEKENTEKEDKYLNDIIIDLQNRILILEDKISKLNI